MTLETGKNDEGTNCSLICSVIPTFVWRDWGQVRKTCYSWQSL